MCLCLDSTFLRRAMPLGCTELGISNPNAPVVARNASRLYLMMPLDEKAAIPPCKDAICITSSSLPESPPEPSKQEMTMPLPNSNGHDNNGTTEDRVNRERGPGIAEMINEAEELRNVLQDASNRLSRLLAGLKHNRRQSRAVQAAMHSLRQLKLGD